MTIKELLDAAAGRAVAAKADAGLWDARLLLAHALGGVSPLALDPRQSLDEEEKMAAWLLENLQDLTLEYLRREQVEMAW